MKYVDEFRNTKIASGILKDIRRYQGANFRIMEVCGTHTHTIFRYGLGAMLPAGIELLSGPGCPVCVTPVDFIDRAVAYSKTKDFIIATFGDMLKVPGSKSSLEKEKAGGKDVRVVYSALDALQIAAKNPHKKIVFLGIGFEATAPTVAASIIEAGKKGIDNFYVLCGHKVMPPALEALAKSGRLGIDAFMLPAHVSAIIGSGPYSFIAKEFGIDCVIAGFEPLDILQGILMLLKARARRIRPGIKIQYVRVVKKDGNKKALALMNEVFRKDASVWRGLGEIPDSGLAIKDKYRFFNAEFHKKIMGEKIKENPLCLCGDVLKGVRKPFECRLFGTSCSPQRPVGPCMVSGEGACAAYFKYGYRKNTKFTKTQKTLL